MLPAAIFEPEEADVALAGMDSLLGGLPLPDLSLPGKSRTLTLLLTLDSVLPLKLKM